MSGLLIDSSVLVYTHDPRDRAKQIRAVDLLTTLTSMRLAVLSVQCLTEFFRAVRWRLPDPIGAGEALQQVEILSRACEVLPLTTMAVLEGCRASEAYGLAFWDALIWAVAKQNQVAVVLTEDLPAMAHIEGVSFHNPLANSFDLSALVS